MLEGAFRPKTDIEEDQRCVLFLQRKTPKEKKTIDFVMAEKVELALPLISAIKEVSWKCIAVLSCICTSMLGDGSQSAHAHWLFLLEPISVNIKHVWWHWGGSDSIVSMKVIFWTPHTSGLFEQISSSDWPPMGNTTACPDYPLVYSSLYWWLTHFLQSK